MIGRTAAGALLLAVVAMPAGGDDIYTWTDKNGTVHISQTPRPGAKKFEPAQERQDTAREKRKGPLFLGGINDTNYYLDPGSVQVFANDRHRYRFNLYVNDKVYSCTAWAYPSGIIGLEPRIGLPDMVSRTLRIALVGK